MKLAVSLLSLAWPTIVTFTILSVRSLVDVWLVGRVGPADLAALAPAQLVLIFILSFGFGSLIAVNAFVAQARGAGRTEECGRFAWQGIWLCGGYGAMVSLLGFYGAEFFEWFGHEPDVTQREVAYFRIAVLSSLPQLVAIAAINFFLGIERPLVPMFIVLGAVVIHTATGLVLVPGSRGMAALGIEGAAWALVFSACFQAILLISMILTQPSLRRYGGRCVGIDIVKLKRILQTGIPIGFRDLLDNVVWSLALIWLIGRWGTIHMAAASVLLATLDVMILPCDGLGAALVTVIGDSIGRGKISQARRWFRAALGMMTLYAAFAGVLFWGFRRPLLDFLAGDPGVSVLAQNLGFFLVILLLFYAWYSAYDHALCGAGDNLWPAIANGFVCVIVLGGGGLASIFWFAGLESYGAWSVVTMNLACVIAVFRFRWGRGAWIHCQLVPRGTD